MKPRHSPFAVPDNISPAAESVRRRNYTPVAIGLVTLLALAIRLYRLDSESLFIDELRQVSAYGLSWRQIVLAAADQAQPPLDYLIGALLYRLGLADSDWWVRLPAALFGSGGVALLAWWVMKFAGLRAGLIAALLLVVCPLHVAMSQEARPYAILVFFTLLTAFVFDTAWRRNTLPGWISFTLVLWLLLMTRWDAPHFVSFGLLSAIILRWLLATKVNSLSQKPLSLAGRGVGVRVTGNGSKPRRGPFRASLLSIMVAYALYAPFFIVIFRSVGEAVTTTSDHALSRAWSIFEMGVSAILTGYTERTLLALPSSIWLRISVAIMSLVGLGHALFIAFVRDGGSRSAMVFLLATLPFCILYPFVYAQLTTLDAKPQYLLPLSIPICAGIALFIDLITHIRLKPIPKSPLPCRERGRGEGFRHRLLRTLLGMGLTCLVAAPMALASYHTLTTRDKRDWRSAFTYIQDHAHSDDAFASIGSDTVPPVYHPVVPGADRYVRWPISFLKVEANTPLDSLDTEPLRMRSNRLWMICHKDRMYRGTDQIPVPRHFPNTIRVHDFHGFYILEIPPAPQTDATAANRLLTALETLYIDLPPDAALTGPAIFSARWHSKHGDLDEAQRWLEIALRQCANHERQLLLTTFFSNEALSLLR